MSYFINSNLSLFNVSTSILLHGAPAAKKPTQPKQQTKATEKQKTTTKNPLDTTDVKQEEKKEILGGDALSGDRIGGTPSAGGSEAFNPESMQMLAQVIESLKACSTPDELFSYINQGNLDEKTKEVLKKYINFLFELLQVFKANENNPDAIKTYLKQNKITLKNLLLDLIEVHKELLKSLNMPKNDMQATLKGFDLWDDSEIEELLNPIYK